MMKKVLSVLFLMSLMVWAGQAIAAPVLGGGWTEDVANDRFTNSVDSPYTYNLSGPAWFRVTDYFVAGDIWYVYDLGTNILTTTFNGAQTSISPIGDPNGDAGWTDAQYSHGAVLLAAGIHELTIQGNAVGGLPAHVFTRIDAVPVPAALWLFGPGLVGLAAIRKRFKK